MPINLPKSLPHVPSLEHLKKQAKELRDAMEAAEPQALTLVARHLPAADRAHARQLSQAQHILAREYGFDSWPKLKAHVEARAEARARVEQATLRIWTRADRVLDDWGGLVDQERRRCAVEACLNGDLPLLPVRNAVLFPGACAPFALARPRSLAMLEALPDQREAFVAMFCQKDPGVHEPGADDLQPVGVVCRVDEVVPVPGEPTMLFLEGLERVALDVITQQDPHLRARVAVRADDADTGELQATVDALRDCARRTLALMPGAPESAQSILDRIGDPGELVDAIAANLDAPQEVKGALLSASTLGARLGTLLDLLRAQLSVLEARQRAIAG